MKTTLVVYSCPVVVGGDFNLRVHDRNSTDARQLANLLLSFDMVQHVRGPTHRAGTRLTLSSDSLIDLLTTSVVEIGPSETEETGEVRNVLEDDRYGRFITRPGTIRTLTLSHAIVQPTNPSLPPNPNPGAQQQTLIRAIVW